MVSLPPPMSRWRGIRRLILRWLISSLSIFSAVFLVPGIDFVGPGWEIGIVALVFGLVNVGVRPILTFITCPLVLLTFGLFGLVINAVLLIVTAQIAGALGVQFTVNGFWPAVGGGFVIAVVSLILNILAGEMPMQVEVRRNE